MGKTSQGEAMQIFREELDRVNWQTNYDFTVKDEPRSEAANIDWWHKNTPEGSGETARNKAYLRAYLRIAQSELLHAQGLRLQRGRLWMDRYVISRLTLNGYLKYEHRPEGMYEPAFLLTPEGKKWVEE